MRVFVQNICLYSTFVCIIFFASIANANNEKNFQKTMNSTMAFTGMFSNGQKQATRKEAKVAEKHLSNAVKYASKINLNELSKTVDKKFTREFNLFTIALRMRLEGWKNSNKEASIKGIRGMERFRVYYNRNRNLIYSQLATQKNQSGWISWEPKKGELLPRFGCDKGAVIAWFSGC